VTVREAIKRHAAHLKTKGVDSPRLAAEWLLAHVLGLPRSSLFVTTDRRLTSEELDHFGALVERRARREPLQHILGNVSFCGLEIDVTPEVLIPRPETEVLAEWAWNFLRSRLASGVTRPAALDFGTGSGCLAIALAVHVPEAAVHGLDISPSALAVARRNAARHGQLDRIQFYLSDGFTALPPSLRLDLIVANPPYVARGEIERLQPEVRDFDPHLALDGGPDGLDFYRRLAADAAAFLGPAGRLVMEFGDGQEELIEALFGAEKWQIEAIERDLCGKPRIMVISPYCQ
jgi:release factor glutamine methyltransferase